MKTLHINKLHLSAVATAGVLTLPGLAVLANGEDIQIPENVEGLPFPVADEVIGKPTIIDTTESGTTQTVETMQEEQTYVQNGDDSNEEQPKPAHYDESTQNPTDTIQENENTGVPSENTSVLKKDSKKTDTDVLGNPVETIDNSGQENQDNLVSDANSFPVQETLQNRDKLEISSTQISQQQKENPASAQINYIPEENVQIKNGVKEWNIKGSGTVEDPYQIATVDDIDFIREHMSSHYILMNDIDLSQIKNFIPIGWKEWDDDPFYGVLNGNGHKIMGINISQYNPKKGNYGLFAYAGAGSRFENLNLFVDYSIDINDKIKNTYRKDLNIGGLIGSASGIDYQNDSINVISITDITINGNVIINTDLAEDEPWMGSLKIGGVVGGFSNIHLRNINNYSNIEFKHKSSVTPYFSGNRVSIGGLLGSISYDNEQTTLECLANFGNITAAINGGAFSVSIGGIVGVGLIAGREGAHINRCINTGVISILGDSKYTKVGGIAGSYRGWLTNTINAGDIIIDETNKIGDSEKNIGGIVGSSMNLNANGFHSCTDYQDVINVGTIEVHVSPTINHLTDNVISIGSIEGEYIFVYQYEKGEWKIDDPLCINNLYNLGDIIISPDYITEKVLTGRLIPKFQYDIPTSFPNISSYCLDKIECIFSPKSSIESNYYNGIDLPLYDIYARVNKILSENGMPSLEELGRPIDSFPGGTKEPFNTYYEGDIDWYTLTYKSSNPEKLDEELSQLVFFNNNPDLLSTALTTWHKSGDSGGTATTTVPITALKGGITSFGLKLGEKIVSEVTCKIIPKFHLSSPGLTLEAESETITLQTDSPFITEDFAKELLDKMTWTISGHEGVGAEHVHVKKGFSNGIVQFIFTVDPYLDASYDIYSKITIKGLSLRDITFNIRQKGFMSAYDLLLMEAVDQYVNPNKYIGELNRILQDTSLPTELRRQKCYEYLSNNGLLNRNEGVAWAKDAYEASHQLQYMTNNDLWLYSLYDDFLRNDPKGQGMIALLYANNLIIGGEYKDYIKPTTYLTEETPEVKKYKTLLYNFMSGTSEKKLASLKIDNWVKLISLTKTATGSEFVQSIKDLYQAPSSQAAFDKTLLQYASKYFGTSKIPDSTGIAIVDKINNGMKYAADAGKVLKVGVDALNYAVKISAMSQVYQDYIDFFETIINGDTSIVPDTLKTAAFQIQCECSAMLEGYELQLTKLATETLWNEITDEILGEFLSDITKTLDLASFVANSLTGYKDFSNQVAYTQGYATLTNLYVSKIQSTAEAYKNSRSPELAKKFTDEYKYLKLLREKGEESYMNLCYKDTAVVKKVIGLFQSTQPWYEDRLNLMMDNIEYAKNAEFIFSETATSTSSRLAYEHKVIVQCPVDVQVYKGNELLFTIRDGHESDVSNEYGRFISVKRTFGVDYAKVVYLNDPDCYIKLIGQRDGLVTISHSQLKGEDVLTTVSDYNPVSAHSIMTYRLNDTDQKIEIDFDGDGNVDDTTILYPVSQEIILPGEIRVTKDRIELEKGQSIAIGVDILPFNTTNKDVLWESADESIIRVKHGVLHAEGPGTTTIFVKTPNGLVSKAINVTVIQTTDGSGNPDIPTDPNKPSPTPNDPSPVNPESPTIDPSLPAHPSLKPTLTQPQSPIIQLNVNHPMAVSGFIDPSSIIQNSSEQKAEHVPTAVNTDAGLSILAMIGAGLGFGLARRRKKVERR